MDPEQAQSIKKQIEFYFSDANVVRDKFLLGEIERGAGWVPIAVLNTFNRVKAFQRSDSEIEGAIRGSEQLDVKDGKVKRRSPVPEKADSAEKTLMVRNLGKSMTLEDVQSLFGEKQDRIARIGMRRAKNKEFKGSAFLEAKTEEDAKGIKEMVIFVEEEERDEEGKKRKKEVQLEMLMASEYFARKKQAARQEKEKKKEQERQEIVDSFKGKIYRFEATKMEAASAEEEKENIEDPTALRISDIKSTIGNCAFVDMAKRCLRLKEKRALESNELAVGNFKVVLCPLTDEEVDQYCKDLSLKKTSKKSRRRRS